MRIKKYLEAAIRRALAPDVLRTTSIGFNVPLNIPMGGQETRWIRIQSLNEESEDRDESPRIYKRTFGVTVECSWLPRDFQGQEADEAAFEDFLESVLAALIADDRLEDQAILTAIGSAPLELERSRFLGIEYRTEPDAERPIYSALMRFDFCYNVTAGPPAPAQAVDAFRSEIVPGPAP